MADDDGPATGVVPAQRLREAVLWETRRGHMPAALKLIRNHWDQYATSEPGHLLAAMRALPGEAFLDDASLVVAADYLQHLVTGGASDRFVADRVVVEAAEKSGSLQQQLVLLTSVAATTRTTGDFGRSVEAALEARRRLADAPSADVAEIRMDLPHLFLQWGRALEVADRAELDVQFEYEEAYRLAMSSRQPQIARRAAGYLAWYQARRGWLVSAEDWLQRARAVGSPTPRYEAVTHLAAALIHLDRRKVMDSAIELARMSAYPIGEYWSAALWVKSWHATTPTERTLLEAEMSAELDRHPRALSAGGSHRLELRATRLRLGYPLDAMITGHPGEHLVAASFEYRRGDFRAAIKVARFATHFESAPRARAVALVISAASSLGLQRTAVAKHQFDVARVLIEKEQLYSAYDHIAPEHLQLLAADTAPEMQLQIGRATPVGPSPVLSTLTKREKEILSKLPTGKTISAIANELFISPNTVKGALRRLYRKLNVTSRAAASDIAEHAGLGDE